MKGFIKSSVHDEKFEGCIGGSFQIVWTNLKSALQVHFLEIIEAGSSNIEAI